MSTEVTLTQNVVRTNVIVHTEDDRVIEVNVNENRPVVRVNYGLSTASVPQAVIDHIARTDNPHSVEESQLNNGPDYVVIFENILSQ